MTHGSAKARRHGFAHRPAACQQGHPSPTTWWISCQRTAPGFTPLPQMRRPLSKLMGGTLIQPTVRAQFYPANERSRPLQSLQPVARGGAIRFEAVGSSSIPLASAYKVRWRNTNTDRMAERANQLRGNFDRSDDSGSSRRETLSYRRVQMTEALFIHKMTSLLRGRSVPFYVVVE